MDQAWRIITNPHATAKQRFLASSYTTVMVEAHIVVILGLIILSKGEVGAGEGEVGELGRIEESGPNVKDTDVWEKWGDFLGDEPWKPEHPDGTYDPDRLTSNDGERSIRYGDHEVRNPKDQHYHEETWEYDDANDVWKLIKKVTYHILKTKMKK